MKQLFMNDDGTIKMFSTTVSVVFIMFLFLMLLLTLLMHGEREMGVEPTTTQKIETTTIKLCNGCEIHFTSDVITIFEGESIDMNSLLSLEKVNLKNIKFEIENTSLVSISPRGSDIILSSIGQTGSTTITASYQDIKKVATIIVEKSSTTPISEQN